jgi:hypothetical protein
MCHGLEATTQTCHPCQLLLEPIAIANFIRTIVVNDVRGQQNYLSQIEDRYHQLLLTTSGSGLQRIETKRVLHYQDFLHQFM